MTVKERVADVMGRMIEWQRRGTRPYDWNKRTARFEDWTDHEIKEFVITQIVEMARNDGIEDCAIMLDAQAAGFQVLIDHAPTPIRAEDLKRVKHSIEVVAGEIRKLAEESKE